MRYESFFFFFLCCLVLDSQYFADLLTIDLVSVLVFGRMGAKKKSIKNKNKQERKERKKITSLLYCASPLLGSFCHFVVLVVIWHDFVAASHSVREKTKKKKRRRSESTNLNFKYKHIPLIRVNKSFNLR